MPQPNILFITSDQQRGDCYGFRGRKVQTPHLDLLAAEGMSLETVITPCVVCQPARASILTGLLPRTHGVHDNGIDLDPELGRKGFAGSLSACWLPHRQNRQSPLRHLPHLRRHRHSRKHQRLGARTSRLARTLHGL